MKNLWYAIQVLRAVGFYAAGGPKLAGAAETMAVVAHISIGSAADG